jgi:hypothetical protein
MIQEASGGAEFDSSDFRCPEIGSTIELLLLDATQRPPRDVVIGGGCGGKLTGLNRSRTVDSGHR